VATSIVMPKLGLTMTAGAVALWVADEGQRVAIGDVIVEITTEKITYEVEAQVAGVLLKIVVEEGEVAVGTTIGVIGEPGEDITALLDRGSGLPPKELPPGGDGLGAHGPSAGDANPPTSAPTRPGAMPLTAAGGRPAEAGVRVIASPAARKLAAGLGVDLATVSGSGPGNRITTDDVQAAHEGSAPSVASTPAPGAAASGGTAATAATQAPRAADPGGRTARTVRRVIAYAGMRRAIGEHMAASRDTSPTVTHHVRADVHELTEALLRVNEGRSGNDQVSVTAVIVKAVAVAIEMQPAINATLEGDEILVWQEIDVGVAVSVSDGLIVPVIRDANLKSASEISGELRDLARRAREGALLPDEVSGGTFTVTSLSGYGSVDWFTPIINQPEAAILGVGRVIDDVIAVNRSIVVRHTVGLSLTFDHRIIDGAPAAEFLKALLDRLGDPEAVLA